jgi:hypothetical protein
MLAIAIALALAATPQPQERVPELTLGSRTGAIAEPFSDAMGLAELRDGNAVVSDRIERVYTRVNFSTGQRQVIGRNGTGPNEYQNPFGPIRWRADTLLAYDPQNRRYLKVTPEGAINGSYAFPDGRSSGITGWSTPRGVDPAGRIYWDMAIIQMQPVVKRSMKARLVRWLPGSASPEVAMEFADHGEFEHEFRFRPMPQTDAWVVDAAGRIGILSAAEYRLRWYRDGALVETGPPVPHTPTHITDAEREAFRARKALEPGSGGSVGGTAGGPAGVLGMERARAAYPDSIFPEVMPPFEPAGVFVAPDGNIWVRRTEPASTPNAFVDILDAKGTLRARLRLPTRGRLFALGARCIYLLTVDSDGFQVLERYAYPVIPR